MTHRNLRYLSTRGKSRQTKTHRDKGRHPDLSRRGAIQISMIHSIHILTSRDGMRREGNEIFRDMIPEENCNPFTNLEGNSRTMCHGSPRGLMS